MSIGRSPRSRPSGASGGLTATPRKTGGLSGRESDAASTPSGGALSSTSAHGGPGGAQPRQGASTAGSLGSSPYAAGSRDSAAGAAGAGAAAATPGGSSKAAQRGSGRGPQPFEASSSSSSAATGPSTASPAAREEGQRSGAAALRGASSGDGGGPGGGARFQAEADEVFSHAGVGGSVFGGAAEHQSATTPRTPGGSAIGGGLQPSDFVQMLLDAEVENRRELEEALTGHKRAVEQGRQRIVDGQIKGVLI